MKEINPTRVSGKVIVKRCHVCGTVMESVVEEKRCPCCKQSFLPTNYFGKVHAKNEKEFERLFAHCDEIHEEDLIKGITVIW